jgi:hypothetical protein
MSIAQLGLGSYHVGLVATTPGTLQFLGNDRRTISNAFHPDLALNMRPVPGIGIQFCIISRHRSIEAANAILSVPFGAFRGTPTSTAPEPTRMYPDVLVFAITTFFALRRGTIYWSRTGARSLFHTLVRDGLIYFLFILLCHVVSTFTLLLGRVSQILLVTVVLVLTGIASSAVRSNYPRDVSTIWSIQHPLAHLYEPTTA